MSIDSSSKVSHLDDNFCIFEEGDNKESSIRLLLLFLFNEDFNSLREFVRYSTCEVNSLI